LGWVWLSEMLTKEVLYIYIYIYIYRVGLWGWIRGHGHPQIDKIK